MKKLKNMLGDELWELLPPIVTSLVFIFIFLYSIIKNL